MGLFDQVMGAASGLAGQSGQTDSALLGSIMQLVGAQGAGGLSGLLQMLQKGGLGDIASSWVGTGQNLPISADQIQSVFSSAQIGQIASQLGVGNDQASGALAEYLPKVIDMLTPDGTVPESGDLMSQGLALLQGKLFG
ncbi:MAG: DUF937 domain-containing protein [Gammaproteobacteria bacterium]|nr:DUF937 domain-containing protein [Gammaproteobacteria bacterium]MCP5137418.1 DUF937 domain-containing protein [Gammaproteobacteria bacterium]